MVDGSQKQSNICVCSFSVGKFAILLKSVGQLATLGVVGVSPSCPASTWMFRQKYIASSLKQENLYIEPLGGLILYEII